MTAGDRVRQRAGWPPEKPTGRKPDFNEPNAAEWRYQRYRYKAYRKGRSPDDVLPFDRWKRRYFEPAARGGRPGRPGGPAHRADVARNNAEPNEFATRKIGGRWPDGVGPPGKAQVVRGQRIVPEGNGRVIFESDHFIHGGAMPNSAARAQVRAIRRGDPGATIVITDVARPKARPLIYRPGTQPPPPGRLPRNQAAIVAYP